MSDTWTPDLRTLQVVCNYLRAEGDEAIAAGAKEQGVCLKLAAARINKGAISAASKDDALTEGRLNAMVADPRYWRDRDPEFIARVSEGFEKLYSDRAIAND